MSKKNYMSIMDHISGSEYMMGAAILLLIYYLIAGISYLSCDIKNFLSGQRKMKFRDSGTTNSDSPEEGHSESGFEKITNDEFTQVEHLIERLKEVIADTSGRKLIPNELKQYLSLVLHEYPSLADSPLRSAINELIIKECKKYRAITLDEQETEMLWDVWPVNGARPPQ